MKKNLDLNCAIIGSTKIAKIHTRELIKNNIKDITLISRNKKKSKLFSNLLNQEYNFNSKYSNHSIIKKNYFSLIDICSNVKFHEKHIKSITKKNCKILVEKPLIKLKRGKNFQSILDKIYLKNKKIFVSYPMFYLAKTFKSNFNYNTKNIKKINFYYQTCGKHISREIFLDLAPHVLGFFLSLTGIVRNPKLLINKIIVKKMSFKCYCIINNVIFNFNLIQDSTKKTSIFKFEINDHKVTRITKLKNNNFQNYLKLKKKIVPVANPMAKVIKDYLKKDYKNTYKINKKLTYSITKITQEIYDQSF